MKHSGISHASAVPAARAATPSDPAEDLRHFSTLHVGPSSAPAAGMVLSCGRAAMTLKDRQLRAEAAGYALVVEIEGLRGYMLPDDDFPDPPGRYRVEVTTPSGHTFLALGETKEEALGAALDEIEQGLGS